MKMYEKWQELAFKDMKQLEYDEFWTGYFEEEKGIYEEILKTKTKVVEGKYSELAEKYMIDEVMFCGFLDGISTSLTNEIDLDNIKLDTDIKLELDYEKLYLNMLDAQADWLYELPAWDDILTKEKREEITKEYKDSKTIRVEKVGRNEPCPCGSGKKYKKCCGK